MSTQHVHERPYVLTCDLQNKAKLFERIGLELPENSNQFFTDFQTKLAQMIGSSLSVGGQAPEVIMIPMEDLANDILSGAKKLLKGNIMRNGVIVSTCLEIASTSEDMALAVNRIVDHHGQSYGNGTDHIKIGPRPGCLPISRQIENIGRLANGRPVIIVEDGIFTGGTLAKIMEMFQKARIKVEAIVVGFAFEGSIDRVKEVFGGEIIQIIDIKNPIDWIPDHDLFPFVPNSGKVVGHPMDGMLLPLYSPEGYSFSIPYLKPFTGDMTSLTSIPSKSTEEVSTYCLGVAKEFFEKLERKNGRDITIRDLMEIRPRISFPHRAGDSEFAVPEVTAREFINKAHIESWSK